MAQHVYATPRSVEALEAEMKGLVGTVRLESFQAAPQSHLWAHDPSKKPPPRQSKGREGSSSGIARPPPEHPFTHVPSTSKIEQPPSYEEAIATGNTTGQRVKFAEPTKADVVPPPRAKASYVVPPTLNVTQHPEKAATEKKHRDHKEHKERKDHKEHKDKEHKHKHHHHHHHQHKAKAPHANEAATSSAHKTAHSRSAPHHDSRSGSATNVVQQQVVEQRRVQIEEERKLIDTEEERFRSRRSLNVPPPAATAPAPSAQVLDRLTTLAAALRQTLAQLLHALKQVELQQAPSSAIDSPLTALLLHVGEAAALTSGPLRDKLQNDSHVLSKTAVHLSVLYKSKNNPDLELNLQGQRLELKKAIEELTATMQSVVTYARAILQSAAAAAAAAAASSSSSSSSPAAEPPKPRSSTALEHQRPERSSASGDDSTSTASTAFKRLSVKDIDTSDIPPAPPGMARSKEERARQSKAMVPLPAPTMLTQSLSQGVRERTSAPGAEHWTPPFFVPYEKLKREVGAPCPIENIDGSRLEAYLKDEEFQRVFEMSKQEFYQLPGWRQRAIKINRKLW